VIVMGGKGEWKGKGERLKVTKGVGVGTGIGDPGQEVDFVWVNQEGKRKVEEWVREWSLLGNNKAAEGDGEAKSQPTSE